MVEQNHGRGEYPSFSPGVRRRSSDQLEGRITDLPEYGRFTALPRLDFLRGYTGGDFGTMRRMTELLNQGGPLEEIGRGGDMVAYSRLDLGFVIKFPYNDASWRPAPFNIRLAYGYSLAKEYLGGIFTPSIDVYGEFTDRNGKEYRILTLAQQKARTLEDVFDRLESQDMPEAVAAIKERFIGLNIKMWERGIFDRDGNWEENYGLLPDGTLVIIDAGWLSDEPGQFASFEGIPRTAQYERGLRAHFSEQNFRKHFGTKIHSRRPSHNPRARSLSLR